MWQSILLVGLTQQQQQRAEAEAVAPERRGEEKVAAREGKQQRALCGSAAAAALSSDVQGDRLGGLTTRRLVSGTALDLAMLPFPGWNSESQEIKKQKRHSATNH